MTSTIQDSMTTSTQTSTDTASVANQNFSDEAQKLVRGEISAIETYDQVIEKFKGLSQESALQEMRTQHIQARTKLEGFVAMQGDVPEQSSGIWGSWAEFTTGTAKIFGESAALKALIEGEEHGLKDYQDAIEGSEINMQLREEIQNKMIPQQQMHIDRLNKMMSMQ